MYKCPDCYEHMRKIKILKVNNEKMIPIVKIL